MQVVGENIGILVHRPILKNIDRTAAQNIHRLLNAAAQKIHLQVERPTIHIVVEIPDVGIVALLVIGLGAVALGQHLGQRGFAAADISGYRNVHKSDVLATSRTSRRTAGPLPVPSSGKSTVCGGTAENRLPPQSPAPGKATRVIALFIVQSSVTVPQPYGRCAYGAACSCPSSATSAASFPAARHGCGADRAPSAAWRRNPN